MADWFETEEAGQHVVETALGFWRQHIVEPQRETGLVRERAWIDSIIRSDAGLNWPRCSPTQKEFRKGPDFEWCGAFAAACWRAAGLDGRIAFAYFASTYRLDNFGRYIRGIDDAATRTAYIAFPKPASDPRRHLVCDEHTTIAAVTRWRPQPGDIVMVTQPKRLPKYRYGSHIAIVERWDPERGVFETIEGNATGCFPDGSIGQGVVRQTRKVGLTRDDNRDTWHVRRIIRPSLADLTAPVRSVA